MNADLIVDDHNFQIEVQAELKNARQKFPDSVCSGLALMEEVGELAQALLKVAAGKWDSSRIRDEAIQVAVMAQRVATEGDRSVTVMNYSEGV